jgi:hypothetical protein
VFLVGLREALNNLLVALCIMLVDVLVATARCSSRGRGQTVQGTAAGAH